MEKAISFLIVNWLFFVQFSTAQQITITPSTTSALSGGSIIEYKVVATNNTSSKISSASISDPIPSSPFTFVPNSLMVSGTNLTCSVPTTITESISISGFDLLPNESITYVFKMFVPEFIAFPGTAIISHTSTFGAATTTVSNNVTAIPNLTISKAALPTSGDSITKGGVIQYTITITNTGGTGTAQNVVFNDNFDSRTRLLSKNVVIVNQNYLGTYTINSGNDTSNTSVNVSLGNIPQGGSATIVFQVRGRTFGANATSAGNTISNFATTTQSGGYATITSNTTNHVILKRTSACAYRDVYHIGPTGNDATGEVNNVDKPFSTLLGVVTKVNASGGNAYISFIEHYYTCATLGTGTLPVLTTGCVTVDGNNSLIDNTATFGGLIGINGGNNDTIKDFTLYRGNVSGSHTIEAIGSGQSTPLVGFNMQNIRVSSGVSVVQTLLKYTSGTIDNCEWSGNTFGAIDIKDCKGLTFNNCSFNCNQRAGFGGAINIVSASSPVTSSDAPYTNITFNGGSFNGNQATGTSSDGGGIYFSIGTLTIDGTTFNANTSASSSGTAGGGALRIDAAVPTSNTPRVTIKNALFIGNKATAGKGGGIDINTPAKVSISNSQFISDTSSNSGGGAIYSRNDSLYITNCYFTKNKGSAIVNDGTTTPKLTVIDSTTISGNGNTGSGLGVTGTINTLSNSVICSNKTTAAVEANLTVTPATVTNSLYGASTETINNVTLTAYYNGDSSVTAPSGWSFVNSTSTAIQQGATGDGGIAGYWLLENRDTVTSPNIDLTGLTNVTVQFRTATYGTVTTQKPLFDYSLNGGSTWTSVTPTAATSTTYVNALAPLNLGAPNVSNFRMRFSESGPVSVGVGVRIDNMTIKYDNPIPCPSAGSVGGRTSLTPSTLAVYNNTTDCPGVPTITSTCPDFNGLVGTLSLASCRFLNTYTGNFANGTPIVLDQQQLVIRVIGYDSISSPANYYKYKFLITDNNGLIKEIIKPTKRPNVPDSTFYTPASTLNIPGTYRIYGYYFDTTIVAGVPVLGNNISTVPGTGCGKLTSPITFEVLNPIVETVNATCVSNNINSCGNRYISTVTVTGGYPQYASNNGLYIPYYTIGMDPNYVPTSFTNSKTGWVSYNTPTNYINTYVSGKSFGVKTTDDKSCITYPYTLDIAAYATPSTCQLTISGNTYHDTNGLTDATINGTQMGNPNSTTLYAFLYYVTPAGDSLILATTTVTSGGTFSFGSGFSPNQNYMVAFSSTPISSLTLGTTKIPVLSLPTNWVRTGDGVNTTVDGIINMTTPISVDTSDYSIIKFGFEQRPIPANDTDAVRTNPGGTTLVTLSDTLFKQSDPDGRVNMITITQFPNYASAFSVDDTVYYKTSIPGTCPKAFCKLFPSTGVNIDISGGNTVQTIAVDPVDTTNKAVHFIFSATDNASYTSLNNGAVYVPFVANYSLPVTWLTFSGRAYENKNMLYWSTASEIDTKEFIIERSNDAVHFEEIGEVKAYGNSSQINKYELTDVTFDNTPIHYYRIKSVDFSTEIGFTNIISLSNSSENTFLYSLQPNPAKEKVYLSVNSPSESELKIQIINNLGEIIWNKIESIQQGKTLIPLDASILPGGIYFVIIKYGSLTFSEKLVIWK